jgi:hypothetical protein
MNSFGPSNLSSGGRSAGKFFQRNELQTLAFFRTESSEKPHVLQPWDESRAEGRFRSITFGDLSPENMNISANEYLKEYECEL